MFNRYRDTRLESDRATKYGVLAIHFVLSFEKQMGNGLLLTPPGGTEDEKGYCVTRKVL